jgi:hypothetical protein
MCSLAICARTCLYRKQAGDSALESLSANGLSVPLFVCTDRLLRQRCVRSSHPCAFRRQSISAPSGAERSSCSRRSAARLGTDARMRLLCAPRGRCNERDKSRKRMRLLCDADASTPMADAFVRRAAFFATRTAVAAGACMRAPRGHVQDGGSAPPLKRSLSDGGACGRSASALRTARRSIALRWLDREPWLQRLTAARLRQLLRRSRRMDRAARIQSPSWPAPSRSVSCCPARSSPYAPAGWLPPAVARPDHSPAAQSLLLQPSSR